MLGTLLDRLIEELDLYNSKIKIQITFNNSPNFPVTLTFIKQIIYRNEPHDATYSFSIEYTIYIDKTLGFIIGELIKN